jgi:hypothetical protein
LSHITLLLFQGFITSLREVALDRRVAKSFLAIELRQAFVELKLAVLLTVLIGLVDVR